MRHHTDHPLALIPVIVASLLALATLVALAPAPSVAQPLDGRDTVRQDTLRRPSDSAFVLDPTLADTALRVRSQVVPILSRLPRPSSRPLGSLADSGTAGVTMLTKRELVGRRYFTLAQALEPEIPAYPLRMGSPLHLASFSYVGADPDAVGWLYNGRPLCGPGDITFDPLALPAEFAERIEIVRGARALLFAPTGALMAVNVVQPHYDAEGSYARFWYLQGINATTGVDVTYARNVGRSSNVAFGLRRLTTDGVFTGLNGNGSGWSGRGAVTWYPSPLLTLSLTEIFTDNGRGENGGLTPEATATQFGAIVNEEFLRSERTRHDLTLAAAWFPRGTTDSLPRYDTIAVGGAGDSLALRDSIVTRWERFVRADSTLRLDLAAYYTHAARHLLINDLPASGFSERGDAVEDLFGARGAVRLPLGPAALDLNGLVEHGSRRGVRAVAAGLVEGGLGPLAVRGGGRIDLLDTVARFALVGEGVLHSGGFELRGSLRSDLDAGGEAQDPNAAALLVEVDGGWSAGDLQIAAGGLLRRSRGGLGEAPSTTTQGRLRTRIPLPFGLALDHRLLVNPREEGDRSLPILYGSGDLYGQWTLLSGNLDLRVGGAMWWQTGFTGLTYDVVTATYQPVADSIPERMLNPLLDLYVRARIGSAYLKIEWRNLLGNEFYTLYRYPTFASGFYLGVNWALID